MGGRTPRTPLLRLSVVLVVVAQAACGPGEGCFVNLFYWDLSLKSIEAEPAGGADTGDTGNQEADLAADGWSEGGIIEFVSPQAMPRHQVWRIQYVNTYDPSARLEEMDDAP